jgi:hypothetical protein
MPEVWEQKGHLRAGSCFRGYIQEELKDSKGLWPSRLAASSDRMWTETPRTTTGAAAGKSGVKPNVRFGSLADIGEGHRGGPLCLPKRTCSAVGIYVR